MLAVEREALNPLVASIGYIQHRLGTAQINRYSMRAKQLSGLFSGASECADVLSFVVVLDDVALAITVADIEIAVWRNR